MPRPLEVKALDNYRMWRRYSGGAAGIVDLSDLVGKRVFALWNDQAEFQKVHIGPSGEIALRPDALYFKITGKKPEELFPKLRELSVPHA